MDHTIQNKMYGVVYNKTYGGFRVNDEIFSLYKRYGGIESIRRHINRTDPMFVKAVEDAKNKEEMGSHLAVEYIENIYEYKIHEYDGLESVSIGKVKGCQ
jgi:hypothetical protein